MDIFGIGVKGALSFAGTVAICAIAIRGHNPAMIKELFKPEVLKQIVKQDAYVATRTLNRVLNGSGGINTSTSQQPVQVAHQGAHQQVPVPQQSVAQPQLDTVA